MKTMKRLVGAMISAMCCVSFTMSTSALALDATNEQDSADDSGTVGTFAVDTEYHATGAIEVSEQEREAFYASFPQDETEISREMNPLPSSVDLSSAYSKSLYFQAESKSGSENDKMAYF